MTSRFTLPEAALGHMTRCAAEPNARRWLLTADSPPLEAGELSVDELGVGQPSELSALFTQGIVTRLVAEPRAIWVWLDPNESWSHWAEPIDAALRKASLMVTPAPDAVLSLVAHDAISGTLADFISSHGGEVRVSGVSGGVVTAQLGGACGHCPLADVTLHLRIERAIRERFPELVEVRRALPASEQTFQIQHLKRRVDM